MKANLTKKWIVVLGLLLSACGSENGVSVYEAPHRGKQFVAATDHYGPLIIPKAQIKAGYLQARSKVKPWSTWWYPVNEKFLFDGDSSPLRKFDRYARSMGKKTDAAGYEASNIYSSDYPGWAGHCHAVAYASILVQPEPKGPVKMGGEVFSTGDLKALALKTYDNADGFLYFGEQNRGSGAELKTDIYPDQFHRVLQAELVQKSRPFIVDKDPKYQVWNYPVYFASVTYDRLDENTLEVYAVLRAASPHIEGLGYDFEGTHDTYLDYSYRLYGNRNDNGDFEVVFGEWINSSWGPDSTELHPDFVIALPDDPGQIRRQAKNHEIDPALVDRLLESVGAKATGTIFPNREEGTLL